MKKLLIVCSVGFCLAFSAIAMSAQGKQRVRFAAGASSATIKGVVRGYAYKDYLIGARAGQSIELKLTAAAGPTPIFSVFLPGGGDLEEAAQMSEFSGTLPANGDYIIRVGMMRADARRKGSASNFTLRISID